MPYRPWPLGSASGPISRIQNRGTLKLIAFPGGVAPIKMGVPGNNIWRVISITTVMTPDPADINAPFGLFQINDATGVAYYSCATIVPVSVGGSGVISFSELNSSGINFGLFDGGSIGNSCFALGSCTIIVTSAFGTLPASFTPGLMLVEEW